MHRRRLHTKCVAVRMRHMNHVRTRMHGTPINRLDNAGFPPAMLMVEDVSVLLRIVDAALSLSLPPLLAPLVGLLINSTARQYMNLTESGKERI